jgi:hypothetical protein
LKITAIPGQPVHGLANPGYLKKTIEFSTHEEAIAEESRIMKNKSRSIKNA